MTEGADSRPGGSAGAMLRAAREKQGLHIAALAAAIKVTPRKLDALEHDRYDELPDATFTRALAQTVCRSLKIDPAPVLARLPQAETPALDHVTGTLNTPFRERPGRDDPGSLAAAAIRPMVIGGIVLLLAAAAVVLVPHEWWPQRSAAPETAAVLPPAPAASAPAQPEPVLAVEPSASAAEPVALASAPAPATSAAVAPPVALVQPALAAPAPPAVASAPAAPSTRLVQLHSEQPSWCEARDARGTVLLSRIVQAGETVGLDGALPIKLTIGNAAATQVSVRGKPVELAASTLNNVARLEVQ